jgi:tyrosyl-tRNA synthetase
LIRGGGIYVNNERVQDERIRLTLDDAIDRQLFLVRKGQKQNFLIRVVKKAVGGD